MKRIKKINANIEKKELEINRLKNVDRKKRANRLIQKGALLEKYFDVKELSVEETEKLLKKFSDYIIKNK